MRSIPPTATALVCLAVLALLAAGCGSSGNPGVAHLDSASTSSSSAGGAGGQSSGSQSSGSQSSSSSSGGSGGAGVAIAGGSAADQQKMVAFAQCMRSHGVPDFPEPAEGKLLFHSGPHSDLNPGSPQFQSAQKACQSLMPHRQLNPAQSAEFQAKALQFSACMRSHGVPNFPDPQFSGGHVALTIGKSNGIDPSSPQFQAARKACQSQLPGGGPGGPP